MKKSGTPLAQGQWACTSPPGIRRGDTVACVHVSSLSSHRFLAIRLGVRVRVNWMTVD